MLRGGGEQNRSCKLKGTILKVIFLSLAALSQHFSSISLLSLFRFSVHLFSFGCNFLLPHGASVRCSHLRCFCFVCLAQIAFLFGFLQALYKLKKTFLFVYFVVSCPAFLSYVDKNSLMRDSILICLIFFCWCP